MRSAAHQKPLELVEYERLNISKLAFRFDLDRATVRKRLTDAGVEPVSVKANESTYELSPRVEAVLGKVDDRLDEAKLRAATADAELKEGKVLQMRGEYVAKNEFVDIAQKVVGAIYREYSVHQPRRIGSKLAKAKTAAEVIKILKADTDKFMQRLRGNFQEFLG